MKTKNFRKKTEQRKLSKNTQYLKQKVLTKNFYKAEPKLRLLKVTSKTKSLS